MTTPANPESLKCWPAVGMSYKGKYYAPGTTFDVHDASSIGIIGAQPSADRWFRIDFDYGGSVQHNLSITGKWVLDVSEADADAHVSATKPEAEAEAKPKKSKKA